jgi:1-deoxy-D-xylulose-5-phosphate reductoisomerase
MKQVVILGATGSVGQSTLSVLALHPNEYTVLGLSAHSRMAELAKLTQHHQPAYVAVPNENAAKQFKQALGAHAIPTVLLGEQGLCELAALQAATHVVAAIVGAAGLPSCMAAAKAGKTILLANKEALVMAGSFFLQAVKDGGATLLPLDSEHNALFQCLPRGQGAVDASVRSVWLTASGGPFLNRAPHTLQAVTPDEACKHPKWAMGRKISVDSATLMNKGLEVIEAALMYGLPADKVKVVIHPQSTIHALVQYVDGSLLAHLSHPDMRVPIAQALAYPQRMASSVADLDMTMLESLSFAPPDTQHFPCLALAYQALAMGQHGCIALNAANEVAVEAFLNHGLAFADIATVVRAVLNQAIDWVVPHELAAVYALDAQARQLANVALQRSVKA